MGSIVVLDLRLLGLSRRVLVARLSSHVDAWTLGAFAVAVASGLSMFTAHAALPDQPGVHAEDGLVLAAGVNAAMLHVGAMQAGAAWDVDAGTPWRVKLAAAASILPASRVIACAAAPTPDGAGGRGAAKRRRAQVVDAQGFRPRGTGVAGSRVMDRIDLRHAARSVAPLALWAVLCTLVAAVTVGLIEAGRQRELDDGRPRPRTSRASCRPDGAHARRRGRRAVDAEGAPQARRRPTRSSRPWRHRREHPDHGDRARVQPLRRRRAPRGEQPARRADRPDLDRGSRVLHRGATAPARGCTSARR